MFLFFRIISALSGAGVFAIVGGSLSDLYVPEERAQAMSFFAATTLIGPCFGPVLGSLIADNLYWYKVLNSKSNQRRWVFHIQTIYAAILLVLIVFTLPETYAPKLARTAHGLSGVLSNTPSLSTRILIALKRPISIPLSTSIPYSHQKCSSLNPSFSVSPST
jgi:MFS family permease